MQKQSLDDLVYSFENKKRKRKNVQTSDISESVESLYNSAPDTSNTKPIQF